jgi:FdhE protein
MPAAADPTTRPWLRLLDLVDEAAADDSWRTAVPAPGDAGEGRPLLDGVSIRIDAQRLRGWTGRLLDTAGENDGPAATLRGGVDRLDASRLLRAALTGHPPVEDLATEAGIDAAALGAVAPLLPVPLLRACASAWAGRLVADWQGGHCPVCGAWPTLVEARGLERTRQLRCGACGGDWKLAWLTCPYCRNTDHERLRVLAPETGGELRKVEACDACGGYVKTFTTLTARPAPEILRQDAASIELDVAALERGYRRPVRRACELDVRVVLQERRTWGLFTRR